MRRIVALSFLVLCLIMPGCASRGRRAALALERTVNEIASEGEIWPGYDPLAVPLAVYDGTNTYLFRHPNPPKEFTEDRGVYVFAGRHPAVVANSSASIGDVVTATVWLETLPEDGTERERAAVVIHEGFHVFQRTTGRQWGADESQLFLYPVDHFVLLSRRRLETEALRRAFRAEDDTLAAGWAHAALSERRRRFKRIDEEFAAYERGIELLEGTATYVEYRAAGRAAPEFPEGGFSADDVRSRAYTTGVAWALLLDQFDPGWKDGFAEDDRLFLDTELAEALRETPRLPECSFTIAEQVAVEDSAREDVLTLLKGRVARREAFDDAPGWKLIVEATEKDPLWPQGFDPLNVSLVCGGVLHTRFLKLGNEHGDLEVMGDTVLTEGVGPHPLLSGVLRMTLNGFNEEPPIEIDGDRVSVDLPTLKAEFTGAEVEYDEDRVVIRLMG